MSYSAGRAVFDILENCTRREELDLPGGEFTAKFCRAYKITFGVADAIAILLGIIILLLGGTEVGALFLFLGIPLLFFLPTIFSYKCLVNKTLMREEYLVLFFKVRKEVLWNDIKYKKVKIDGRNDYIKFYDANQKRLLSFDSYTVGFTRIVKMAKRGSILNYKK